VGVANVNCLLDKRVYEVKFADGHSEAFAANVIAESLYSQVNAEGNDFTTIHEICVRPCSGAWRQRSAVELLCGFRPLTRRSQTGVLIFLNQAPIVWLSKWQNTFEAGMFVAMRIATELLQGLRYKL
jgi:hypothetical protein